MVSEDSYFAFYALKAVFLYIQQYETSVSTYWYCWAEPGQQKGPATSRLVEVKYQIGWPCFFADLPTWYRCVVGPWLSITVARRTWRDDRP